MPPNRPNPPATAWQVQPLTPQREADFLAFFDGVAFADNPRWGSCYCQFLHVDHTLVKWPERSAEQNRAAAQRRIATRRMQGYLAYGDGRPVGWCNAAPRPLMEALADEPDPEAACIGQIGCFVVAPAHRRAGVASALLRAACEGFRAQGLDWAEASPAPDAAGDAQNHFGPLALFVAAGFTPHRSDDAGRLRVRLDLRRGAG